VLTTSGFADYLNVHVQAIYDCAPTAPVSLASVTGEIPYRLSGVHRLLKDLDGPNPP
jgi:hypothetical protein